MAGQAQKRKDKNRIVLKQGEWQRPNGTYDYRWTDFYGKRHVIYAKTLDELREKERKLNVIFPTGSRPKREIPQ